MNTENMTRYFNRSTMYKKNNFFTALLIAAFLLPSCGPAKKEGDALLNDKRSTLEKLKADQAKNEQTIEQLERELSKLDTSESAKKPTLVSVAPVAQEDFEHYIDLQGHVDAENTSYIAPRSAGMMAGGVVRAVYIRKGDLVRKGQPVLKLDDAILQQQHTAATEQLSTLKTQLDFARNLYARQKNVWEQGIGTEVQLLSAKNNVNTLENQLRAAQENIKIIHEQLRTTTVYSDVSGVADEVNIRVGETFVGATAMGPQIKIVNTSSLKAVTNVPENYGARIRKGTPVRVYVPDLGRTINTSLTRISQSIDPTQRSFMAEAGLPAGNDLKPNQLVVVKIMDYSARQAVVIPVNVMQTDENGRYVFTASPASNGRYFARKKPIVPGEIYGDKLEVKSGLQPGERIITVGYQNVYEGQPIEIK
jgi:RND family efflux transporter MFP subunit